VWVLHEAWALAAQKSMPILYKNEILEGLQRSRCVESNLDCTKNRTSAKPTLKQESLIAGRR
jgi:hypothetical protein